MGRKTITPLSDEFVTRFGKAVESQNLTLGSSIKNSLTEAKNNYDEANRRLKKAQMGGVGDIGRLSRALAEAKVALLDESETATSEKLKELEKAHKNAVGFMKDSLAARINQLKTRLKIDEEVLDEAKRRKKANPDEADNLTPSVYDKVEVDGETGYVRKVKGDTLEVEFGKGDIRSVPVGDAKIRKTSSGKKTFSEATYAKDTDKDDDGEGMDPVGKGDDDIDNDGDSDESDEYLKKRRKAIGKAMKKKDQTENFNGPVAEAKSATGYEIYHKDFSSAVQHAIKQVEKKGYTVDDDEWDRKVALGPRKPSKGKTNIYTIALLKDGKETKRNLQMQVYYDEGRYELNMYIS